MFTWHVLFIYFLLKQGGRGTWISLVCLPWISDAAPKWTFTHLLRAPSNLSVFYTHTHTLAHTSVLLWTWSEKLRIRSNVLYTPKVMWFYSLLCGVNGVSKLLSWMHQCVHVLFLSSCKYQWNVNTNPEAINPPETNVCFCSFTQQE